MNDEATAPSKSSRRAGRARIQPYLSAPLRKRFRAYCAATGHTESAIVQAALAQYLDGTSDHALLMRRIDRLGRAFDRLERDVQLLSEAFAVWVQIWFAHTPAIPVDGRDLARRESAARFQQFVDYVATKLSHGRSFVDSLARERIADDQELLETVEAAGAGQTAPEDA